MKTVKIFAVVFLFTSIKAGFAQEGNRANGSIKKVDYVHSIGNITSDKNIYGEDIYGKNIIQGNKDPNLKWHQHTILQHQGDRAKYLVGSAKEGLTFGISTSDDLLGTHPYNLVMTLKPDTKVGIGTEQPDCVLHTKTDDIFTGRFESTSTKNWSILELVTPLGRNSRVEFANRSGAAVVYVPTANKDALMVMQNGNVGIGLDMGKTPSHPLHTQGTAYSDGLLVGSTKMIEGTVATINGAVLIADDEDNEPPMQFNNAEYGKEFLLWVEEGIVTDDVAIAEPTEWSDHVFEEDYNLMDLTQLEAFIRSNKHLPNIPSQPEVLANGYTVNAMNAKLLEKIEELTLYTIAQEKEIGRLKALEKRLASIEKQLSNNH